MGFSSKRKKKIKNYFPFTYDTFYDYKNILKFFYIFFLTVTFLSKTIFIIFLNFQTGIQVIVTEEGQRRERLSDK